MPQRQSLTSGLPGRVRVRSAWMLLMISTINFHYALGKEAAHTRPVYGPATEAQRASHMRLSVAADALVDRAPSDMVF